MPPPLAGLRDLPGERPLLRHDVGLCQGDLPHAVAPVAPLLRGDVSRVVGAFEEVCSSSREVCSPSAVAGTGQSSSFVAWDEVPRLLGSFEEPHTVGRSFLLWGGPRKWRPPPGNLCRRLA